MQDQQLIVPPTSYPKPLKDTTGTFGKEWKSIHNLDRNDSQKEMIKQEISNIAMRIVKAREAKMLNPAAA